MIIHALTLSVVRNTEGIVVEINYTVPSVLGTANQTPERLEVIRHDHTPNAVGHTLLIYIDDCEFIAESRMGIDQKHINEEILDFFRAGGQANLHLPAHTPPSDALLGRSHVIQRHEMTVNLYDGRLDHILRAPTMDADMPRNGTM